MDNKYTKGWVDGYRSSTIDTLKDFMEYVKGESLDEKTFKLIEKLSFDFVETIRKKKEEQDNLYLKNKHDGD
jgi:hypothetical protein